MQDALEVESGGIADFGNGGRLGGKVAATHRPYQPIPRADRIHEFGQVRRQRNHALSSPLEPQFDAGIVQYGERRSRQRDSQQENCKRKENRAHRSGTPKQARGQRSM